MKKDLFTRLFLALLTIPLVFGCNDCDNEVINILYIPEKAVNFLADEELSKTVSIQTGSRWQAKVLEDANWCSVEKEDDNTLNITLSENEGALKRSAKIEVSTDRLKDVISVEQLGSDLDILVDKNYYEAKTIGDILELKITTNTTVEFTLPEWISEAESLTRAKEMVSSVYKFNIEVNKEESNRQGTIEIHDKGKTISQKVIVNQKGLAEYNTDDKEGLLEDIKIKPQSVTTSSEHPSTPITLSIDGDMETFYHSAWDNSLDEYFPIDITYNFEEAEAIDYIIYYPRYDQDKNGNFKEVEIQAIYGENNEYQTILTHDFEGSTTPTRVMLPQSIATPKSVRFVVKSGTGDNNGFAACSEMEFYQYNAEAFDYSTLFTDESCSELKSGVTKENIDNCKYPFYQNMAFYMLNDKYEREFRVESFKAYPHPDIQALINKTSGYSLRDNPTGIYVEKDEEVVVFAKDLQGAKISVLVQNLDVPEGDGFGGPSFPISTGLNKFKAPNKGLLYVMYHNKPTDQLDTYLSYPLVKLHFATGTVNGYFDSQKHKEEDWSRLLDKASGEYFDVLGKYAHLTYPISVFKASTPSGLELINIYDKLVHDEMELMGLFKYDTPSTPRVFRNRMYFNVMYQGYMYAAAYRTGYNIGTLSDIANPKILPKDGIWGPAHEVGHCNQTSPGLKWVGMTEVSNNIHSQYVQTNFGNVSRLQGEDMGEGSNRFEKAMASMFPNSEFSYSKEPDVFCKLVPLWQLQLYCSWVNDNNDFYKDIHEDIRLDPDKGDPGMNQMWFAYRASKASGYDLTDFFEKWGFFASIDEDIEDYWTERMTITPASANKVKTAIKGLNLPKPKHALEYITDRTTNIYKSNTRVTSGTFTISNNSVTTTGCENIVAIEVFDNEQLVFVSTRPNFRLINELNNSNTVKMEAISADGSRINLNRK